MTFPAPNFGLRYIGLAQGAMGLDLDLAADPKDALVNNALKHQVRARIRPDDRWYRARAA